MNTTFKLVVNMFNRFKLQIIRKRKLLIIVILFAFGILYFSSVFSGKSNINDAQRRLDYIAVHLHVKLEVLGNQRVVLKLNNTGSMDIVHKDWAVYFFTLKRPPNQELEQGFTLQRENGGLFFLTPNEGFNSIPANRTTTLVIKSFDSASKFDHSPNWYVVSKTSSAFPKLISNTVSRDLSFIEEFTDPIQWKRNVYDRYNPYPPEQRYEIYSLMNQVSESRLNISNYIVPTPLVATLLSGNVVTVDKTWTILTHPKLFEVAGNLSDRLNIKHRLMAQENIKVATNVILFSIYEQFGSEEYRIQVTINTGVVEITSATEAGAFYAVKSLLSLMSDTNIIPHVMIRDKPRFPIRGLMIDTVRHFFPKETLFKVIDTMAMYKLNTLHLHLTDDEGWRVEIPSIPELTQFGSKRCHNHQLYRCIPSSLGSGPSSDTSGSGFYSVSDFREILKYASERFVKVVPEIDVPGHSMAAIIAMQYREDVIMKRSQQGGNSDPSYLLTDSVNPSAESVQGFTDNAMNPCINSSYRFLNGVIGDLKFIYEGIQPLHTVHLGGDEVPSDIWVTSPACRNVMAGGGYDHQMLRRTFMIAAAEIAARYKLNITTWEDGMYDRTRGPYDRGLFKQSNVYVQAWNNPWEGGMAGRAVEFANAGYKSILSMATHLYFDHAYEPDPNERGLYWAARYTDTYKVFSFLPDDIYENADFDSNGNEMNRFSMCSRSVCPTLQRPENIVGMEACIWSETIFNAEELMYMMNPRLIAFAERSWHKAAWESIADKTQRDKEKLVAYGAFMGTLGYRELPKLEKNKISYRIPPPGIHKDELKNAVTVNSLYPNHVVQISLDNGGTWSSLPVGIPQSLPTARTISFRTLSPGGTMFSRSIDIKGKETITVINSNCGKSASVTQVVIYISVLLNFFL